MPSAALATMVGTYSSPFAEVERWDDADAGESSEVGISPERRDLRALAQEAVRRARSIASETPAIDGSVHAEYESPPLVVRRRVLTQFRRVEPLAPPSLDADDLPL